MANLQIRIDDALKTQAQAISNDLGMDVATAVRIFLVQMVRERALPFTPSLEPLKPVAAPQEGQSMPREEWLRSAVHTGLQALQRNDFVPEERIKGIFAKAGASVG